MRFPSFALLAPLIPAVLADVEFVVPAAGASIPAGALTVTWQDSGTAPSLSLLTTFALSLMVGGNDGSATPLTSVSGTVSTLSAALTITPGLAASTENGFFLKIISTGADGGTVINYSSRFTVTGMTGVTSAANIAAVAALAGSTSGPATVNTVNNGGGAAPAAGAGGSNQEPAGFGVPYNLQSGLTKYAPMQPVPPTSISATAYTPLFPTSAYTLATTFLGLPSIQTTITQSQTFSVSSMENTAAAAAYPTGDMAKFLARWKD